MAATVIQDHLVKLLLLGDSAVGKSLPRNTCSCRCQVLKNTRLEVIAADAILRKQIRRKFRADHRLGQDAL